jgi:hypothetical protein
VGLKASAASIVAGTILILSATVAPSSAAGTLSFYDGTKKIAAVKATKGAAKFATTKLSIGRHALKVTFTPSSSAADTASSSKVVQVTVKK